MPSKLRDDDGLDDYEQLRHHLGRPTLEHPASRQQPRAPATLRAAPPSNPPPVPPLSVMDWMLALGHMVVRRLRSAPRSAMVRLHPRK